MGKGPFNGPASARILKVLVPSSRQEETLRDK